ncbi:MAG: hypothetical protein N2595_02225 [bacterium]|nr:hypothetical protein [bacterium]
MNTLHTQHFARPISLAMLTWHLAAAPFSWQMAPARVDSRGDLHWQPQPALFRPGAVCRYIDFVNGNDSQPGTNAATAWKHHPWDPQATGRARSDTTADTYIFKRGVVYRGALLPPTTSAGHPIQLTVDPTWGHGEACLAGSELVTNWQRGAHPRMPIPDHVWYADLPFAPRAVFLVDPTGAITRLNLARTPNWRVTDPDDPLAEWWLWENPRWWTGAHKTNLNGRMVHLGIDTQHLSGSPEDYVGGYVWTEWGVVMGAPYATKIEAFDPVQRALAFEGPWLADSQQIHRHNRYMLEDLPHFLDEPGEFWFEKRGPGGRLYVWLPHNADPRALTIEAACRPCLLDASRLNYVHINGLTFRFNNPHWHLEFQGWQHPDVECAAIRVRGSADTLAITHCRFEHVVEAIRLQATAPGGIANILIADNIIAHTDHGGITLSEGTRALGHTLSNVRVLRNYLRMIGFRPARVNGHMALTLQFPDRAEVAGNIIERCGGAGIFVFGGKASGTHDDVPFTRILIHHNKVVDSLLIANDWGGIETWQGGPFYVFNNVSGNPGGLMHWTYDPHKREGTPRFGHAYYLDGAFKNYHFNNIAWGKNNDLGSKYANCAAFQEIIGYQNTFFNNTVYKFVVASRRQAPQAGRNKYLGNVFVDISQQVFRHSDKEGVDPNARDAGAQAEHFAYETLAYANNVFYAVTNRFGVFEAEGGDYTDWPAFRAALQQRKALAWDSSVVASTPPLRDPAQHDFRPTPSSDTRARGVRSFVPWALYAVVGEWHFLLNHLDPTRVFDEHWYLTHYHVERDTYYQRPTYDLRAVGVQAQNYVPGPLENWTRGALQLNGYDQYLLLEHDRIMQPYTYTVRGRRQRGGWARALLPESILPGQPFEVKLSFPRLETGLYVCAHLHWIRGENWGGFNAWGGPAQSLTTPGPYVFRFVPEDKEGLTAFSLLVFLSPTGNYDDHIKSASVLIGKANPNSPRTTRRVALGGHELDTLQRVTVKGTQLRSPQVHDSSFLIEAYLKFDSLHSNGIIIAKTDGTNGWGLYLTDPATLEFRITSLGASHSLLLTNAVATGQWHHVVAEFDRPNGWMTLYLNGTQVVQQACVLSPSASLANPADLLAGKNLACTLEFLRLALGTLADAHTTIEELYAWQFDGPQYRDFTGCKRLPTPDAGALQSRTP